MWTDSMRLSVFSVKCQYPQPKFSLPSNNRICFSCDVVSRQFSPVLMYIWTKNWETIDILNYVAHILKGSKCLMLRCHKWLKMVAPCISHQYGVEWAICLKHAATWMMALFQIISSLQKLFTWKMPMLLFNLHWLPKFGSICEALSYSFQSISIPIVILVK